MGHPRRILLSGLCGRVAEELPDISREVVMNKVEKVARTMRKLRVQIANCPFPIKDVWFNKIKNRVEFELDADKDDFFDYMNSYMRMTVVYADFTEYGCIVEGSWFFVRREHEV